MDFANPLRWPSVVFIVDHSDLLGLELVVTTDCRMGDSTSSYLVSDCSGALSPPEGFIYEDPVFVFNPSLLSPENQTVLNLAAQLLIEFQIICKLLVPFRLHNFASSAFQIIPRTVRQAG